VFNAPAERVPLELGIGAGSEEPRMMGLAEGRKSFKIGSAVLIQYRRVTDSQPSSQPRHRSIYTRYAYLRRAVKMHSIVGHNNTYFFYLTARKCRIRVLKNTDNNRIFMAPSVYGSNFRVHGVVLPT